MFSEGTEERIEIEVNHPCLPEWRRRIEEAKEAGGFSEEERSLAANWDTCAVGEGYVALGKKLGPSQEPRDPRLAELGAKFYIQISNDSYRDASETLDRIEARLKEVF